MIVRNPSYVLSKNLLNYSDIPWKRIWNYGTDFELIAVISLDRNSFLFLLDEFSKHYLILSGPGRSGRPHRLPLKSTVLGKLNLSYNF